tara:strand:- start:789 stop:1121 length:333 start_codon:yes stop_codon:yes gene_type:complete
MIELPEEIVEYIISFTCDRRGYNKFLYNERKKANWIRMRRIRGEIKYFGLLHYSVGWLRTCGDQKTRIKDFKKSLKDGHPVVSYHTGCYRNSYHEIDGSELAGWTAKDLN